jgi:two-component system CheB/CheR fusion protein
MPAKKKKTTEKKASAAPAKRKKKPAARKAAPEKKRPKGSVGSASKKKPSEAFKPKKTESDFPVVGIGASAGGLEAFEKFFKNVRENPGIAFVLIPHLDPTHTSMMPELIQKYTNLKVVQVEDGMEIEKNRVYVIPPDNDMGMVKGKLMLAKSKMQSGPRAPVNFFLRSLAEDQTEKAVGVILSGMGMDGTEGVKAIKAGLGMVMVQDPVTCKYDSMPRNAIATSLVDYVLPPEEMAETLRAYVRRFALGPRPAAPPHEEIPDTVLNKIHMRLRSTTGHDFSAYKESTIIRRIQRRMSIHQIDKISDYLGYLDQNVDEVKSLFKELLIGVTGFFRDPVAFDALKLKALPDLLREKPYNYNLRAWVPGGATGEEAYSLAMLIQECMDDLKKEMSVQIFATDIDDDAIEKARVGMYPGDISADVSAKRLEKFFYRQDDSYRINRKIREMLIFATQSVIKDPPFTRMDLICCRNLLIYLQVELQRKLLPLFYYSLRPGGILFLGSSESIGDFADHFSVIDNKWKIYRRTDTETAVYPPVNFDFGPQVERPSPQRKMPQAHPLSQIIQRYLVEHHTPPSIVIDSKGDIAYIHGRTGNYLELAPGTTRTNNIHEMALEGLRTRLPSMIRSAVKERKERRSLVRIPQNGGILEVNVTVKPLPESEARGYYMVLFEELPIEEERKRRKTASSQSETERVRSLEEELRYTRENLQTTIEELETSNEELRSINEEYQSANEELQSANEELNSSKEELQSLNEELETVNSELQGKNFELMKTNDDMRNLLDSVELPTIFLDNQLRIKRFTSHIDKLIKVRESDVERPLSDLATNLRYENLVEDAKSVLASLIPREFETLTMDGRWYLVRIRPYRSGENVIEGLVMTFVDIHEQKVAKLYKDEILDTVREPLLVMDGDLQVKSANRSFYNTFKVSPKETEGRHLYEIGNRQWNIPRLRKQLEEIIPKDAVFVDFEVEHEFPKIGRKKMLLNARKIESTDEVPESILLAIEDITEKS